VLELPTGSIRRTTKSSPLSRTMKVGHWSAKAYDNQLPENGLGIVLFNPHHPPPFFKFNSASAPCPAPFPSCLSCTDVRRTLNVRSCPVNITPIKVAAATATYVPRLSTGSIHSPATTENHFVLDSINQIAKSGASKPLAHREPSAPLGIQQDFAVGAERLELSRRYTLLSIVGIQ
jgi:hypothetical protein